MKEPKRIELNQSLHNFAKWCLSSGWQLVATLIALYLMWDVSHALWGIHNRIWNIESIVDRLSKN